MEKREIGVDEHALARSTHVATAHLRLDNRICLVLTRFRHAIKLLLILQFRQRGEGNTRYRRGTPHGELRVTVLAHNVDMNCGLSNLNVIVDCQDAMRRVDRAKAHKVSPSSSLQGLHASASCLEKCHYQRPNCVRVVCALMKHMRHVRIICMLQEYIINAYGNYNKNTHNHCPPDFLAIHSIFAQSK